MYELANLIEVRLWELEKNLELTNEDIFEIICQEYQLNADSIETKLSCKCPFVLTGLLKELENSEISKYLN
ncbi:MULTISPECIES: hypothetical protein [unclassified Tolypothrix]|uniref:hypothetical protein n=1 Tax=unclassified Tolypothrix TaxID=2649714 RepID=UPI0005EAB43C|nr:MULTISPECIES: hypothetical protein [unclassified Tolypothrix]EKE97254.1 hypothetical protein FDUTEX481_05275 [Tolypothrix sp. PCC 7601]MBE9084884.1 hypothetical protein [Tolypothrix sp. LEGE 11397]BAY95506.1 hypothetical protein NIES3275_75630 [Microchaete diplosiphon NIES-3275]